MIILKIGGNMINHLPDGFFEYVAEKQGAGEHIIIVHGGSNIISKCGEFVGEPVKKIDGIRVTNSTMMKISDLLLNNVIQEQLSKKLMNHGIATHNLNSYDYSFVKGNYLDHDKYGEVGTISHIDTDWINKMTDNYVGLMSSIVYKNDTEKLNVNADIAASEMASLLRADELILLTDVCGVKVEDRILEQLNHKQALKLIDEQYIVSGMIPKVKAALDAIDHGVDNVTITNNLDEHGTVIIN